MGPPARSDRRGRAAVFVDSESLVPIAGVPVTLVDMDADATRSTLLARVRDPADEESWREFDARYRELILRYCRKCGLQPANAEDVHQLVMLSLSRSLRHFTYQRELGRFRDYLRRTVRNAISRFLSGPGKTDRASSLDEVQDSIIGQDDVADEIWEREWIHHHFRIAMKKARRAFEPKSLKIFEHLLAGDTPGELAVGFGISVHAILKIKQRVRAHLEALISEQLREEDFDERAP